MNESDRVTVNRKALKHYREQRGWSQVKLAKRSGLTQSEISRIELGGIVGPSLSTVSALANALGLPLFRLMEDRGAVSVDPMTEVLGRDLLLLSPEGRLSVERFMRFVLKEEQEDRKGVDQARYPF